MRAPHICSVPNRYGERVPEYIFHSSLLYVHFTHSLSLSRSLIPLPPPQSAPLLFITSYPSRPSPFRGGSRSRSSPSPLSISLAHSHTYAMIFSHLSFAAPYLSYFSRMPGPSRLASFSQTIISYNRSYYACAPYSLLFTPPSLRLFFICAITFLPPIIF
jgi:hypothetical protein